MKRKNVLIGLTGGLLLLLLAMTDLSFSQARRPREMVDIERLMNEQRAAAKDREQQNKKIMEQYSDQAYREALGADESQWNKIKPRFERVKKLLGVSSIGISVYGGGAGGSGGGGGYGSSGGGYGSSGSSGGGYGSSGGGYGGSGSSGSGSGSYGSSGGYGSSGSYGGYSGGGGAVGGGGFHTGTDRPIKAQIGDMSMGWTWHRPSLVKKADGLTEAERACEKLLDVPETNNQDREQIKQKVTALRKIREQNRSDLLLAQQQLREVVTFEQEAKLVLMGYLD